MHPFCAFVGLNIFSTLKLLKYIETENQMYVHIFKNVDLRKFIILLIELKSIIILYIIKPSGCRMLH